MTVFNELFFSKHQTILVSGGSEPVYLPVSDDDAYAQIIFTGDYFASALHEVAHWCLAGPQRLANIDYGYWYIPDRNPQQQRAFERVEVKPQALEQLFSEACGFPYRPSFDNLQVPEYSSEWFNRRRIAQYERYKLHGMPAKATQFHQALTLHYQPQSVHNRPGADD